MSREVRKTVMAVRSTLAAKRDLTRREVRALLSRLCDAVEELDREASEVKQHARETEAALLAVER